MRAADTNILLRIITADDPQQERLVRDILARERLFVTLTVTLECAWVLRSYYRYSRELVAMALTGLIDLPGFVFDQSEGVIWACDRLSAGAEIDDMVHLIAAHAARADAFVTFDNDTRRRTAADPLIRIDVLR